MKIFNQQSERQYAIFFVITIHIHNKFETENPAIEVSLLWKQLADVLHN